MKKKILYLVLIGLILFGLIQLIPFGKDHTNWKNNPASAGELAEVIQSGEMPPIQYTLFHPSSVLSDQQKQDFIQGLQATLGQ